MSAASKLGSALWKGAKGAFRLLVTRPATVISSILAVLALILGCKVWRVGLRAGWSSLLGLVVCLLAIVVILLSRGRLRN